MSPRAELVRLETRVLLIQSRAPCPHLRPLIHWLSGDVEDEGPRHQCGKPRMVFTVGYSDGSDERTQKELAMKRECLFRAACDDIKTGVARKNEPVAFHVPQWTTRHENR